MKLPIQALVNYIGQYFHAISAATAIKYLKLKKPNCVRLCMKYILVIQESFGRKRLRDLLTSSMTIYELHYIV